ncbi:MAG: hypothetical protein KAR24_00070 [Candidatus Pacebacteria bacterium]|nr:hypothetical protein [Candidatus Paceibacterota bacterium]MCK5591385.1 hypothetical protein [Candidatus Paceibacterota bacterium]
MESKEEYKRLMTEIISKQAVILGPEIAIMRARGVKGLTITDEGQVITIENDPKETLQHLIDQYVELSGQIVKATLGSIFKKYPAVEKENS